MSITQAAMNLNVACKTVSKLVNGKTGVSPEMALRLELAFGKSACRPSRLRFIALGSPARESLHAVTN
ncbi:MAG: helix-turn-helix transcriptional regulator [Methylobacter sp.]